MGLEWYLISLAYRQLWACAFSVHKVDRKKDTMETKTLQDIINEQKTERTLRGSDYSNYGSKKKLLEAQTLATEVTDVLVQIKNTFSFSIHKDHKYIIVTIVKNKVYSFLVVDTETMAVTVTTTIRQAKKIVAEFIAQSEVEVKPEAISEEPAVATETEAPVVAEAPLEVVGVETPKSKKHSRKNR